MLEPANKIPRAGESPEQQGAGSVVFRRRDRVLPVIMQEAKERPALTKGVGPAVRAREENIQMAHGELEVLVGADAGAAVDDGLLPLMPAKGAQRLGVPATTVPATFRDRPVDAIAG